eukprot:1009104-Rhodomonas_salina.2
MDQSVHPCLPFPPPPLPLTSALLSRSKAPSRRRRLQAQVTSFECFCVKNVLLIAGLTTHTCVKWPNIGHAATRVHQPQVQVRLHLLAPRADAAGSRPRRYVSSGARIASP